MNKTIYGIFTTSEQRKKFHEVVAPIYQKMSAKDLYVTASINEMTVTAYYDRINTSGAVENTVSFSHYLWVKGQPVYPAPTCQSCDGKGTDGWNVCKECGGSGTEYTTTGYWSLCDRKYLLTRTYDENPDPEDYIIVYQNADPKQEVNHAFLRRGVVGDDCTYVGNPLKAKHLMSALQLDGLDAIGDRLSPGESLGSIEIYANGSMNVFLKRGKDLVGFFLYRERIEDGLQNTH